MGQDPRTTDAKDRVSLPEAFADASLISEHERPTGMARVIPEDDWPYTEETPIVLSVRDLELFLQALDHPPEPNLALRTLMADQSASIRIRHEPG